jgi:hypothetical protein
MKKNTIVEIAELSGYSIATVSRVLNNSKNVSSKAKAKITEVINETGYIPSDSARNINMTVSRNVIVLYPDLITNRQNRIFSAIVENAEIYQNSITVMRSKNLYDQKILEKRIISLNPEAIVLLEEPNAEILELIENLPKINFIAIENELEFDNYYTIENSFQKIAQLAQKEDLVTICDNLDSKIIQKFKSMGIEILTSAELLKLKTIGNKKLLLINSEDAYRVIGFDIKDSDIYNTWDEESDNYTPINSYNYGIYIMSIINKLRDKSEVKKVLKF